MTTTKTFPEDGLTRTSVDAPLELMPGGRLFFHADWISGADEESDLKIDLTCGAGGGSSLLQVSIEKDGKMHYWHVSMADWLRAFVDARLAEGLPTDGTTDLITTKVGNTEVFESVRD